MATGKREEVKIVDHGAAKDGTVGARREKLEEELIGRPGIAKELSDEKIAEINKLYRLSAPIKIPLDLLNGEFEYHWINKSLKNFRRRRGIGWKIVTKDILVNQLSKVPIDDLHMGTHFNTEGQLCLGDDMLFAYIEKRVTNAIKKSQHRDNQERLRAGTQRFHDSGKLLGVETYEKHT